MNKPYGLPIRSKVFAYITHANRLLVFRHRDFPDAGIQVPAGTVRPNEDLVSAALREAHEETGLTALSLVGFLGEQRRDMRDFDRAETHHRSFFHLEHHGEPADVWYHDELDPADGGPPVRFELFWAPLPDGVPTLVAGHDAMLAVSIERMNLS